MPDISEAMVEAACKAQWQAERQCKNQHDAMRAALEAALSAAPASAQMEGWPKECATEGCGRAVAIYFQRGGVGSHYCCDCYMRIQAIPARTLREALPAPEGKQ